MIARVDDEELDAESPQFGNPSNSRLGELFVSAGETFRRRLLTFALVTIAVIAIGAVAILRITPQYEATARIRIDPSRNALAGQRDSNSLSDEAIDTEVTVLSSPEVARDVASRLGASDYFRRRVAADTGSVDRSGRSHDDARLNAAGQKFLGGLDVRREKLTYIIAVRYKSEDAEDAAKIANAFAETYVASKVGGSTGTAGAQAEWLNDQLRKQGAEIGAAEKALAEYRARTGTVESGPLGTVTEQQVAPLSIQLASAQSDAAEARAKLAAARRLSASGNAGAIADARSSPVNTELQRQLAQARNQMADIRSRYGPLYPETIKIRDQIVAIESQIAQEQSRALASLQSAADATSARATSLSDALAAISSRQIVQSNASVEADKLTREVSTKRAAYDKLAQQSAEANQSAHYVIANAQIVDRAQPPRWPTFPNRTMLAAMTGVLAVAMGVAAITFQEMSGTGLRSSQEIEKRLGVRLLTCVPAVSQRKGKGLPADIVISQPASLYAETMRTLRLSVLGAERGKARTVAFTSSIPDEGKTTTALSFARMLAMNGTRTLLIDCDLRKASLKTLVNSSVEIGLVQVLRDKAAIDDAIIVEELTGLSLLCIDEKIFPSEDLFGDGRMELILAQAKSKYSVIVLDLPPLMGVADARTLTMLADKTIMIVRWNATPARAIEQSVKTLYNDGVKISGVVFTMVDPNAEAIGGIFYSKKYNSYYQSR